MLITIWPWTSIINILLLKPGSEDASVSVALPELLLRHLRSTTYLLRAIATYWCGYERVIEAAAGASCTHERPTVRTDSQPSCGKESVSPLVCCT
jgi:hypothetical protein